jgi:hypothetical protein
VTKNNGVSRRPSKYNPSAKRIQPRVKSGILEARPFQGHKTVADRYRPQLRQGQMYRRADTAMEFAETRDRVPHEGSRCCIVVEGNEALARENSAKVTVVPTSSRVDVKGEYDVLLPHPPSPNFDTMVRVEYVTPVLRDELGDYIQQLQNPWLEDIMASLARFLDLLGT